MFASIIIFNYFFQLTEILAVSCLLKGYSILAKPVLDNTFSLCFTCLNPDVKNINYNYFR